MERIQEEIAPEENAPEEYQIPVAPETPPQPSTQPDDPNLR